MGTVLQNKDRSLRKWIRRYASAMAMMVVLGGMALLYQYIIGKAGGARLNFDIGSLWNNEGNVNQPILDEDIIVEFLPQLSLAREVTMPEIRHSSLQEAPMETKGRINPIAAGPVEMKQGVIVGSSRMERVELLEIPSPITSELERRYLQQLKKDYLLPQSVIPTKGKWFVGLSFAPNFSYRTLAYKDEMVGMKVVDNTRYVYGMTETYRDNTDQALGTFFGELEIGYNINSRWYLASGISYGVYGEKIQVSRLSQEEQLLAREVISDVPCYASPQIESGEGEISFDNEYNSIEVPFVIGYQILQKEKWGVNIEISSFYRRLHKVNALVYDFNHDYYYWVNQSIEDVFKKSMFGGGVSVGFSQFLGNTTEFILSPNFKMNFLSSYMDDYPVDQKQYSVGLRIGLRKHLAIL